MNRIELSVQWSALTALVNDQAQGLQRAAFSPIVREAGDLGIGLFDQRARMIAQADTGTPGHHNSLARSVGAVLERYGIERLEPGDVLVVNDPYLTVGQLLDTSVITPVWRAGRIIAYVGSTAHQTDIGGYGTGAGARVVYQGGLWIPPLRLMRGGSRNREVWN